jgi:hypothetical protein
VKIARAPLSSIRYRPGGQPYHYGAVRTGSRIITEEYEAVERLAQALLERESLNAVQIGRVVAGLPLDDDRV